MKKIAKRILCALLILCMCLPMLPQLAPKAAAASPNYTVSSAYRSSSFYSSLLDVQLTGNQREDIINVALSQVGYREGNYSGDYGGEDDGYYNNYTEYNYWYNNYISSDMPVGGSWAPWCATFVSWCAEQAGIPTSILKRSTAAGHGSWCFDVNFYSGSGTLANSSDNDSYFQGYYYTPKCGDLFFTRSWSHVGLVVEANGNYVTTVEGNTNNDGSADGFGVFVRTRYIGDLYFGVPNYNESYLGSCTYYPAHAEIKMTMNTEVNSLPCSLDTDSECEVVEACANGDTYEVTGLYRNTYGNLWYEVLTNSGETGYVYAGECSYVKNLDNDISLSSDATAPGSHVAGDIFVVNGEIASKYSGLTEASVYIYSGYGTSGTPVTGDSDTVGGKSYTLDNSAIDFNTSFNSLTAGGYTYAISAKYTNYYATDATTLASTSGTIDLMTEYFMVINAAADQDSCSHSYSTTTVKAATCTANGTQIKTCSKCGKVVTESTSKLGHAYGAWTITKAATCTTEGSRKHTCANCGDTQTEVIPASHNYVSSTLSSTCQSHAGTRYTCSVCGDSYDVYADSVYSAWSTTKPSGVASNLIQTKKQYRYADQVTTTSSDSYLSGYELIGSAWDSGTAGSVVYAPDITSTGFSASSSLYSQYNKSKVTASETDSTKVVINSDSHTGYLYYHWCYAGSVYSVEEKSGSYTTFHAYYDTTDPSNYTCDSSDMSYKTSSSNCSNSNWWFVTDVYTQKYTTYNKVYTHAKWGNWSSWSDTAVSASDTRKVEERTLYRYVNAPYTGSHNYVNGVCTICGNRDSSYSSITLSGKSFSLSFEDEILVNFYYSVSDASNVTEQGMLVFHSNPGTPNISKANEKYSDPVYTASTGYYTCTTDGIAAKEMGDTRYYCAYAKLSDGTYAYSSLYEYSPKKYAMSRLANSTNTEMKALCVAMLNYGAEAQLYFDYNTDNLMNKDLTAEQKALVADYDSALFKGAVPVSSDKIGRFAATATGFSGRSASVSFEGAFAINYYFVPDCTVDTVISFYYWSPGDYAKASALLPSNATGKITMNKQDSGAYWAQVSGIPAKELDETYYVAAFYTCDNEIRCTGVIPYALSKYCVNNAKPGNPMEGLAASTAMYGYCAQNYFDSVTG